MNVKFNAAVEPFKKMAPNGKIWCPAPALFGITGRLATELVKAWDQFQLGPQLPASDVTIPALEVFR